ncbi:MAG: TOBE domain-containing protein [Candidatus Bathyarchaeia archaeon]
METAIGPLQVDDLGLGIWRPGLAVQVLVRPEGAQLGADGPNPLRGTVAERAFRGAHCRLVVRHPSGSALSFHFPASADLPIVGAAISLSLAPQALALLPAEREPD